MEAEVSQTCRVKAVKPDSHTVGQRSPGSAVSWETVRPPSHTAPPNVTEDVTSALLSFSNLTGSSWKLLSVLLPFKP